MAKRPKKTGAGYDGPRLYRIEITIAPGGKVHDGLGGRHRNGAQVTLPAETAEKMIAAGNAKLLDDRAKPETPKQADPHAYEVAQSKKSADQRMWRHDMMPKALRDLAQEYGDDVFRAWKAGLSDPQEILDMITRPPIEGDDEEAF